MLEKLLKRIARGGTFTTRSLAREFGVSQALMEVMISDLERAGYLQLLDGCEQGACRGCPVPASCKPRGKVWQVTLPAPDQS